MGNTVSRKSAGVSTNRVDNVNVRQSETQLMQKLAASSKQRHHVSASSGGMTSLAGHHIATRNVAGITANSNCACKAIYK